MGIFGWPLFVEVFLILSKNQFWTIGSKKTLLLSVLVSLDKALPFLSLTFFSSAWWSP